MNHGMAARASGRLTAEEQEQKSRRRTHHGRQRPRTSGRRQPEPSGLRPSARRRGQRRGLVGQSFGIERVGGGSGDDDEQKVEMMSNVEAGCGLLFLLETRLLANQANVIRL